MAYAKKLQQRKNESGRLRGERDQMKFIDLIIKRWKVVGFRKGRSSQIVPYIAGFWEE